MAPTVAPTVGPIRTAADCATHSDQTVAVRTLLRRGNFTSAATSAADLRMRLLAFIEYFHATMATPFQWTYTGRPLAA